jgi:hypothetical protein
VLGGRAIWFPVWLSRLPSVGLSALSLLVDGRSRVKRSKPTWRTEKWTKKKKKDNTHAAPPKRATKRLCIAQIESGFSRGCLETASRNQQQVHTHMEKSCRISFRLANGVLQQAGYDFVNLQVTVSSQLRHTPLIRCGSPGQKLYTCTQFRQPVLWHWNAGQAQRSSHGVPKRKKCQFVRSISIDCAQCLH